MPVTLDFYDPVVTAVNNIFQERLDDRAQRQKVVAALMDWLLVEARKKPVADLEVKLQAMPAKVAKLVEGMRIEIVDAKPVVKCNGSDEDTLKMFKFGTSWFDPNPDWMATIISGLFNDS